MNRRWILVTLLVIGSGAALAIYASRDDSGPRTRPARAAIPQPTAAQLAAAGLGELPVASARTRVDVAAPVFSNPTNITNPLFPISSLRSAVLTGQVDDKPFRTETTLLPATATIEWPKGRRVETLVSQYVAYSDGRIREVALDHYAQADDGSVWYFGEDVFDFKDGVIASTEGTWFAGKHGPAAMIMPAHPRIGDVFRPENVPGLVFEEVTVKSVEKTVRGPHGPVAGAMIVSELHADGQREDKTFAPGYGEFFTGGGGDVEAMALAIPADELAGSPPTSLEALSAGADSVFDQAGSKNWKAASATVQAMTAAWKRLRAEDIPPRLVPRTSRAVDGLVRAVAARDPANARDAAIDVAQAALDMKLRHRPPAEIDRSRFELWARQLLVDAAAGNAGAVTGDVYTLKFMRDRFVQTLDRVDITRIDHHLTELEAAAFDEDLAAAASEAAGLRDTLARLERAR